jgi:hypothetical protein
VARPPSRHLDLQPIGAVTEYGPAFASATDLVFASPAWLEAIGPERCSIARLDVPGAGPGFVPLQVRKRRGALYVTNPPLTPWLHPVGGTTSSRPEGRISNAHKLGEALAAALPASALVKIRLHPSFPSFLGLHWAGFLAMTRISYRLDPQPADAAWKGLRGELRTDVRKAERNGVTVTTDTDVPAVARLLESHSKATGFAHPFTGADLEAVITRLLATGSVRIWSARWQGELVGAAMVPEDPSTAYYLLAATTERGREQKAMPLVAWSAVRDALDRGLAFDFEGSMLRGVERFNRAFGGHQVLEPMLVRAPFVDQGMRALRRILPTGGR